MDDDEHQGQDSSHDEAGPTGVPMADECRRRPIAAGQRSLRRATGPLQNLTPAGIVVAQMACNSSGRSHS